MRKLACTAEIPTKVVGGYFLYSPCRLVDVKGVLHLSALEMHHCNCKALYKFISLLLLYFTYRSDDDWCRVGYIVFRVSLARRQHARMWRRVRTVQRHCSSVPSWLCGWSSWLWGVLLHQDQRRQKYELRQFFMAHRVFIYYSLHCSCIAVSKKVGPL